jgi:hypothetical protein
MRIFVEDILGLMASHCILMGNGRTSPLILDRQKVDVSPPRFWAPSPVSLSHQAEPSLCKVLPPVSLVILPISIADEHLPELSWRVTNFESHRRVPPLPKSSVSQHCQGSFSLSLSHVDQCPVDCPFIEWHSNLYKSEINLTENELFLDWYC